MKKINLLVTLVVAFAVSAYAQTAKIQVIHNSPVAGLFANFDAYVTVPTATRILDDFSYREATPFFDVPAGVPVVIHLAPASSTSIADTLAGATITLPALTAGSNYYVVAYGAPTPQIVLFGGALLSSPSPPNVALAFFHGGNDAPAVDISARGVGLMSDNLEYGALDGYVLLSPVVYIADIFDSTSTTKLKSYYAPLVTASGAAAFVFASGYLTPGSGQPEFGIFAALANGTVIALPEIKTAYAQVIHNSADAAAATVDVYVKNNLAGTAYETVKIDDLAFRTVTGVTPVEFAVLPNDSITIGVASANSSSINNAFSTKNYKLDANSQYLAIASGILPSSTGYNPTVPFDVYVGAARFQSTAGVGTTDVNIFHGVTDAPAAIDLIETAPGNTVLANDLAYGNFSGYTGVNSTNNYTVEVREQNGTTNFLGGNFFLPLALNPQASGAAIVVFTSGFVDPLNNNNGAGFQLCAKGGSNVPPAATCFSPIPVGVEEMKYVSKMIMYPNPATTDFNIEYMLESAQTVTVNVYNAAGQLQTTVDKGVEQQGRGMATVNVSNLAKGAYFVNILIGEKVNITRSMIIE
jgi:hypothetical protein